VHGRELWRSDGTEEGTELVEDLNLGGSSSPSNLTTFGDTLFLSADDGAHGRELWRSDGTETGTRLVKDIDPGEHDSQPTGLTAFAGTLFFGAGDKVHGRDLWRSDGTRHGTKLVDDINQHHSRRHGSSRPNRLTGIGDTLFFSADDGTHGRELWKLEP
jgi:ELWxxDGT repeat protein